MVHIQTKSAACKIVVFSLNQNGPISAAKMKKSPCLNQERNMYKSKIMDSILARGDSLKLDKVLMMDFCPTNSRFSIHKNLG